MLKAVIRIVIVWLVVVVGKEYKLPVNSTNRKNTNSLSLTNIGQYGLIRKARPGIPSHLHTGIDIKRPGNNYNNEPIYPICDGIVISKRSDGAYAQLIIEHNNGTKFWTVYEHIAGISVELDSKVNSDKPIARFMNKAELDKYGWQFDHFHFEVLKKAPIRLQPNKAAPKRKYTSYTLTCFSKEQLNNCFYNPIDYLKSHFN